MAEGREEEAWNHTSNILATLANVNSTKAKFTAADFNPFSKRKQRQVKRTKNNIKLLKTVFIDNARKGRRK